VSVDKEQFEKQRPIDQLIALMAMLRDSDHGCPWDLKQTIQSLVPYTLEEAYEVAEAIEQNDLVELEDELGDLLFQVVFYAQIAGEKGNFDFDAVARAIVNKLIRRHPHVFPNGDISQFGQAQDLSPDEVVVNWEAIKQQERAEKQARKPSGLRSNRSGELDSVPAALPALQRAVKLQQRAASVGFDWSDTEPVVEKLREEIDEFEEALQEGDKKQESAELGDMLFSLVNLCRHRGVEPEEALRQANMRFTNRFVWVEEELHNLGQQMPEATLEELDALWNKAKQSGL